MIKVLAVGSHPYISRTAIVRMVGDVVLHNQYDMVIVIPLALKHLVECKGIGLMSVVHAYLLLRRG